MGWKRALDASELAFAHGTYPARPGNTLDVLVDGSEMLPAVAQELSRAQSYLHIAGWFFSPELQMSREDEPVIVRQPPGRVRGADQCPRVAAQLEAVRAGVPAQDPAKDASPEMAPSPA